MVAEKLDSWNFKLPLSAVCYTDNEEQTAFPQKTVILTIFSKLVYKKKKKVTKRSNCTIVE